MTMPGIMAKRLWRWETVGWVVTGLLGPLLHFAYEWSGGNPVVAAFAAVNESIWEHMKILFWPLLFWAAVEWPVFFRHYRNFLAVKTAAITAAVALVPVLYYTYGGVWGKTLAAVDIGIYYVAAAAAGWCTCTLAGRGKCVGVWKQVLGGGILLCLGALFVLFTFCPPEIALFEETLRCVRG